jgi:uncharacterized protein (TIGR02391 family)
MKRRIYRCKKCKLRFTPESFPGWDSGKYRFNCCPVCGQLFGETIYYIVNYFKIIQLSEELDKARDLFLKSESVNAVREAVITFENIVRKKSGLNDLIGTDLMAKAFHFKFDPTTKRITERPKIKINNLLSISKRNEQEGIKFISMGVMQGIRNIYIHHKGNERLFYCLHIITLVDLLIKQITGWGSIACRLK